ncbi:UDP-N-acetylglucosamine--LPS N-acetylglucosamine transferase [Tolypothrix sp. LEGE 11397]|nr:MULTISPECIES: PssD/Cps14F family polysaccharide biosynthesis glycosyltransferase [unclassified Tolypothrix]EKF00328.1 oligosaccharide biosynthesis protein [Tolypothrix sp. PCC 7601]MBE9081897.1 UDP-N-acetylglucosamine--LPS N-acetylglucosamine transferase [Tolypothrix sp. LEGE 11397]UYD26961.1 UDP-N-acetylglucosamine--LPS N-acetylglucosamine transferase [Tolypothrix sp. PCC 7712]UYD37180.1 UDP-N-acetylglucosamine--LPS N-acetylglucosamine transferase [Tolypothrix sp. PCC 7601]
MKIMLVCTSGGHFATMRSLQSFWSMHERVWVSDRKSDTIILEESEKVHWLPYQAPRDILALIKNIPKTFQFIRLEKPDVIISTGASIAINFAFVAKILGIRFIYIESISRANELSISGRLVYPISDEFYVQWAELCQKYPKAIFKGYAS